MKKILIALDYNSTAQQIAELGYLLGNHQDAEVTLLHVIGNPTYYGSVAYDPIMGFGGYTNINLLSADIANELKSTSIEFLEKAKSHLGDDRINILVKEGSVAETILDVAKELHVDVIAIGSTSRPWLENLVMGNITEYILHHSSIPLFIIPFTKPQ